MSIDFISCDWGTSSLRLRLPAGPIFYSADGTKFVFDQWKNADTPTPRFDHFRQVLQKSVSGLALLLDTDLSGLPIVISGMASSSIGMYELPYALLPFPLDGRGIQKMHFQADQSFPHDILLLSGVNKPFDVMRGEETQSIGCHSLVELWNKTIFILPGTHSKHIIIEQNAMVDFSTYMTGEFYQLFKKHSILSASWPNEEPAFEGAAMTMFCQGVLDGAGGKLMHLVFQIRAGILQGKWTPEVAPAYLSGLLIGQELSILKENDCRLVFACGEGFYEKYKTAVETLGLMKNAVFLTTAEAENLAMEGQRLVLEGLG